MRSLVFEGRTWQAYEKIRDNKNQLHKSFCKLVTEMLRAEDLTQGSGKTEALKYGLSGFYSRRISAKDRLVYLFDDKTIYIFAIGGHYDQL